MNRIKVNSSNLAEIGYNAETRTLEILFHSGHIYRYMNVPGNVYSSLLNAFSKGMFFDQNIRYSYPCVQVT